MPNAALAAPPAPLRPLPAYGAKLEVERRADGAVILRHPDPLEMDDDHLIGMFRRWSDATPERVLVAKRRDGGDWERLTYGAARRQADGLAQALLDRGVRPGDSAMILSPNSQRHAVFMLAAMTIGVAVAPISPAYALMSRDFAKLRAVAEITRPTAIFVEQAAPYAAALAALDLDGVTVIAGEGAEPGRTLDFKAAAETTPSPAVDAAFANVGHSTIAKLMFTSGSTGWPKGVIQTHGIIRVTLAHETQTWVQPQGLPPPRLSWLPWNHVAGAGLFYYALRDGAAYYIDDGKPVAGLFDETIRNVRELRPKVYIDVPAGFAFLADAMERDTGLRDAFFENLNYIMYAGASLPAVLRERIYALSAASLGSRVPFVSGYGATETGPGVTQLSWSDEEDGNVGLPYPGVEVKLLPLDDGRWEIRVRSGAVTPGYKSQPDLTAKVFDDEGFYMMGDAVRFVREDAPIAGLRFAGRVTEDFKLMTGTFVAATELHSAVLSALLPLARNLLLLGHDRAYLAALVWPEPGACRALLGADGAGLSDAEIARNPQVRAALLERLRAFNIDNPGSSRRIVRMILLESPPSVDANEITDKGYVNQRTGRELRADQVEQTYAEPPGPDVLMA